MLPFQHMESWSMYVVDIDMKTLLVMDPTETSEPSIEMVLKHHEQAHQMLLALERTIYECLPGFSVPSKPWEINFNVGMHPSCTMYGI